MAKENVLHCSHTQAEFSTTDRSWEIQSSQSISSFIFYKPRQFLLSRFLCFTYVCQSNRPHALAVSEHHYLVRVAPPLRHLAAQRKLRRRTLISWQRSSNGTHRAGIRRTITPSSFIILCRPRQTDGHQSVISDPDPISCTASSFALTRIVGCCSKA